MTVNSGLGDDKVWCYFAEVDQLGETEKEEGIDRILLLTEEEMNQKIKMNEITDSFTVFAWCKYRMTEKG